MTYANLVLISASLILLAGGLYWDFSFHRAVEQYKKECVAIRPTIDCQRLAKQIERSRKGAVILLLICSFPMAFIQNLSWLNPISLLLTKFSVGAILTIGLFALKQLFKVRFDWLFSDPLDWRKATAATIVGFGVASLVSLVYAVLAVPALWTQAVEVIRKKLGG